MEAPTMDDTMEMASPYVGQVDDFDIDIDLMEDHVSNMDSDMMGADEFSTTSQPQEPNNDAIFDADMADEPSEGFMVDADNYIEEDNDIDVQLEEGPYEAEMTEGDQAEDAAPPVALPSLRVELSPSNDNIHDPIKEDEPALVAQTVETVPETSSDHFGSASGQAPVLEGDVPSNKIESNTGDNGDDRAEPPLPTVDLTKSNNDHDKGEPDEKPDEEANETVQPSVSNSEAKVLSHEDLARSQEKVAEDPSVAASTAQPSEVDHLIAGDTEPAHHESLHPVKIIYQENEIALFPPLEGDSAETFFLHDEEVAYESIEKLFKSLRQVLQGNVADNEVLVIDIESLGIQMTEDSFHTSQVTLHQVVDLYLKLCRNDGANEPDALYLALSSKRAFPAEIADLLDAANDGKTLSELHLWDEYDEAEPGSEDHDHEAEEHEDEAYYTTKAEQNLSIPEDHLEAEQLPSNPSPTQAQNTNEAQPEDVDREEPGPDDDAAAEPVHADQPELEKLDQPQEFDDHNDAERYESDDPNSVSTATASLAGESDTKTHNPDEHSQLVETEKQNNENTHGEDPEYDDLGPEDYYEDGEFGPVDDEEAFHKVDNDDGEAQQPDNLAAVSEKEDRNELDAAPRDETAPVQSLQDEGNHTILGQATSTLDSGLQTASDEKEQTPEPADDLLGIAVDLMQTPKKDTERDHFEGLDYGDDEEELAAPAAADNETDDNHEFGVNGLGEYDPNNDGSEAVELGATDPSFADSQFHDNASTKRSRDEEDDWDVVNTTLDTKRRRSS